VWTPIKFESPDITGIQMHGDYGTLRIINIYNDCKHAESLKTMELYMKDPVTRAHLIGGNPHNTSGWVISTATIHYGMRSEMSTYLLDPTLQPRDHS
jgi:hypothetical protein